MARLGSIKAHKWDRYHPQLLSLAAQQYMEKDQERKSHWFEAGEDVAIQGLLAGYNDERRVYIVTIDTPAEYAYIHDRWPLLVKAA